MTFSPTRAAVLAVLVVLLGACGAPELPPTGEEALQEVVQTLEETTDNVAAERAYHGEALDNSPEPCKPWWALNSGHRWGYVMTIDLEGEADRDALVRATYDFWRDAGHEVRGRTIRTDPVLFTSIDGYEYQLQANEDSSKAYLRGSTPCLPQVSRDTP
jgi:hypothetical protein